MKFGRPRGTRDFLPDEMGVRRVILDKVRNAFEMHGFEEMDTPAIELWEVLAAKGGDEVERQIYRFQDKGERWLGLRFDLTVPLARVVANTPDLTKPFKRFNISKVWRYEEPQSGRFREFVQADIDIVGAARMEADLECVSTAVDALRALGLGDFEVRINDRKILDGMVEGLGMGAEGKAKVFRSLDRLDKVGEGGVARELAAMGLPEGKAGAVLEFTHFRGQEAIDYVARELASSKAAMDGVEELKRIEALAGAFGLGGAMRIDFSLVRGLDYYTGPVFEIRTKTAQIGSIGGGGRYDRLIERFGGPPTPATGISLGVERLYEVLMEKIRAEGRRAGTAVFVASVNDAVAEEAIKISRELVGMGVPAEPDIMGRKLGRQLEYAEKKGIPYVLIVGPEEVRTGKFKLRKMAEKQETVTDLQGVPAIVR
ncbi:MAG TPA: histidine--tRNA ligase [Candidatus Methanomethylicus sp.]|nr:histidine--tRNA ligase [Candidatus Methanomethylicus sp.]